jgi:hypothetical protein
MASITESNKLPPQVFEAILKQDKQILETPRVSSRLFSNREDYRFGGLFDLSLLDLMQRLAENRAEPLTLLDVGCSHGFIVTKLNTEFKVSAEGLDLVQQGQFPTIIGDAHFLSLLGALRGKRYDLIVSSATVRHLVDPVLFLQQGYAKLKMGGYLITDSIILPGLNGRANAVIQYMKERGYEIIAESTRGKPNWASTQRSGAFDFLVIKKTTKELQLPIFYHNDPIEYGNAQYRCPLYIAVDEPDSRSDEEKKLCLEKELRDFFSLPNLF